MMGSGLTHVDILFGSKYEESHNCHTAQLLASAVSAETVHYFS